MIRRGVLVATIIVAVLLIISIIRTVKMESMPPGQYNTGLRLITPEPIDISWSEYHGLEEGMAAVNHPLAKEVLVVFLSSDSTFVIQRYQKEVAIHVGGSNEQGQEPAGRLEEEAQAPQAQGEDRGGATEEGQ